jgi:hypothetical protein
LPLRMQAAPGQTWRMLARLVSTFARARPKLRQKFEKLIEKIVQLPPRQIVQFGDRPVKLHCILHRSAAPIVAFDGGSGDGGGGRPACGRNEVDERHALAPMRC